MGDQSDKSEDEQPGDDENLSSDESDKSEDKPRKQEHALLAARLRVLALIQSSDDEEESRSSSSDEPADLDIEHLQPEHGPRNAPPCS